jgi:hypothetical protein
MPTQMTKHVTVMILFTPVYIGLVLSVLPCQPLEKKKKHVISARKATLEAWSYS